jgi:hypothetical protein
MHPSVGVPVAAPGNGQCHTKEEAVRVLHATPADERTRLIDDWIKFRKIPCGRKNMCKLLNKFIDNPSFDVSKPWGLIGRDPLLKPEDLA